MTPIEKSVKDDGTTHGESTRRWTRDLTRLDSRHQARGPRDPWVPSPHGRNSGMSTRNFHSSHVTMKDEEEKEMKEEEQEEEEDVGGMLTNADFDILFNQALRWRDGMRGPRGAYVVVYIVVSLT